MSAITRIASLMWLGGLAAVLILVAGARDLAADAGADRARPAHSLMCNGPWSAPAPVWAWRSRGSASRSIGTRISSICTPRTSGWRCPMARSSPISREMATSFSLGALLGGRLEPTRLTVEHPVLLLTRDAAGSAQLPDRRTGTGGARPRLRQSRLASSARCAMVRRGACCGR